MEISGGYRKTITGVVIITNIAILLFFKYFDFLISSVNYILLGIGLAPLAHQSRFLLPVGISFYTFQALGYILDVYRKRIKAEYSIIDYALFVSFFPQLVAGPIERSENLLHQIKKIHQVSLPSAQQVISGGYLILWGLFQKMVIADRVAVLVNTVFDEYYLYGSFELVFAALGFALQIYCDFASYSIIAMGSARILGIRLMENFNTPYFARTIKEFWRRWHISLSGWFSDYLYIPLGGSRCSKFRYYFNLMVVFLISGLWHGANWTYIFWGGIHGVYQIVGDVTRSFRKKLYEKQGTPVNSFSFKLGQATTTFFLVTIAWIFFRATSVKEAFLYIRRIIYHFDPWVLFDGTLYTLGLDRKEMNILIVSVIFLFLVDIVRHWTGKLVDVFLERQCIWFQWLVIVSILWMIFVFGQYGPNMEASQFIYFQF